MHSACAILLTLVFLAGALAANVEPPATAVEFAGAATVIAVGFFAVLELGFGRIPPVPPTLA